MKNLGRILLLFILIFGNFSFAKGEELNLNPELPLNLNPLDAVNSAGIGGINAGDVLDAFKFNFPFNLNNINIDTNIPISPKVNESQQSLPDINLRQFLTPKDISSDDLGGAIKAIAVLIINIFLVVISIVAQILKLILEFLR